MDIAILGYGVVGSGVAEVIRKNGQSIASRAGEPIRVKRILDIRDFPSPDRDLQKTDDIFSDPDIKVVRNDKAPGLRMSLRRGVCRRSTS